MTPCDLTNHLKFHQFSSKKNKRGLFIWPQIAIHRTIPKPVIYDQGLNKLPEKYSFTYISPPKDKRQYWILEVLFGTIPSGKLSRTESFCDMN